MKYTADELHKLSEVLTNFHWEAEFSGEPFRGYEDDLARRVTQITSPNKSHTQADYNLLGLGHKHPGIVDPSGTLTLTFLEDVSVKVRKCFDEWKSDHNEQTESDYTHVQNKEFDELFAKITLKLLNKKDEVVQTVVYSYCSLEEYTYGSDLGDGSSPDYFKPTLTIHFAY